jgi:hypothetical protein
MHELGDEGRLRGVPNEKKISGLDHHQSDIADCAVPGRPSHFF